MDPNGGFSSNFIIVAPPVEFGRFAESQEMGEVGVKGLDRISLGGGKQGEPTNIRANIDHNLVVIISGGQDFVKHVRQDFFIVFSILHNAPSCWVEFLVVE